MAEHKRYPIRAGQVIEACRSCGMLFVWVRNPATEAAVPVSLATLAEHPEKPGVWGAQSHFTDCPNAKAHSKKGKT